MKCSDLCVRDRRQRLLSLGVKRGQSQKRGHTKGHSAVKTQSWGKQFTKLQPSHLAGVLSGGIQKLRKNIWIPGGPPNINRIVWPYPWHDDDEDGGDVGGEHQVARAPLHLEHGGQAGEGPWGRQTCDNDDNLAITNLWSSARCSPRSWSSLFQVGGV